MADQLTETAAEAAHSRELIFVLLGVALVHNIGIPCLVVAVISPNCFYNIFVAAPHVSANCTYRYCALTNDLNGQCGLTLLTPGSTEYAPPYSYSYQCSSSFVTYYAPAFVYLCITATFVTPTTEILGMWVVGQLQHYPIAREWIWEQLSKLLKPLDISEQPQRDHFQP